MSIALLWFDMEDSPMPNTGNYSEHRVLPKDFTTTITEKLYIFF
jgi:hypothetical protein